MRRELFKDGVAYIADIPPRIVPLSHISAAHQNYMGSPSYFIGGIRGVIAYIPYRCTHTHVHLTLHTTRVSCSEAWRGIRWKERTIKTKFLDVDFKTGPTLDRFPCGVERWTFKTHQTEIKLSLSLSLPNLQFASYSKSDCAQL